MGHFRWLLNFTNLQGQMARWLELIDTYNVEIKYRAGRVHGNADALTRRPCEKCRHCERQDEQNKESDEEAVKIRAVVRKSDKVSSWVDGWKKEQITTWQAEDPVLEKLLCWKKVEQRPPWADIKAEGALIRTGWSVWPQLEVQEGLLYRRCSVDGEPEEKLRLVAPIAMRNEKLRRLHDSLISGHLGVRKTAFNVRRAFLVSGMTA